MQAHPAWDKCCQWCSALPWILSNWVLWFWGGEVGVCVPILWWKSCTRCLVARWGANYQCESGHHSLEWGLLPHCSSRMAFCQPPGCIWRLWIRRVPWVELCLRKIILVIHPFRGPSPMAVKLWLVESPRVWAALWGLGSFSFLTLRWASPHGSEVMACWISLSVSGLVRSWFISFLTLRGTFAQHSSQTLKIASVMGSCW